MTAPVLLQTNFLPEADARTTYITLGIFAVFILILIIGSIISSRKAGVPSAGTSTLSPGAAKRKFKKYAKKTGLTSGQIKLMEDIASKYRVNSPLVFLSSPRVFNSTMKKAIIDLDSGAVSPDVRESTKMAIFSIRQRLDRNIGTGKQIATSRQINPGQQITLVAGNGVKYTSHIVANLKDYMCASIPDQVDSSSPKFKKWESFTASFFEKGDRGYTFQTKLIGYTTMKSRPCLMLQHNNSITHSRQRRFPRKELGKACYFYRISVATVGKGKNQIKKAVLQDNRGRLGTIIEISAGGCSIKGTNTLNRGDLVKIDIEIERRKQISILGKIVNARRESNGYNVMHVQFTKMSRNNLNNINSYVYGIGDKESLLDY